MTVADVIEKLGGNKRVAAMFGVTAPAVSNWKGKGCFPPRLHFRIFKACQERGIDVPESLFAADSHKDAA